MLALTRRLTGTALIILGAWAAILPFVGPLFGYRMDNTPAWTWTTAHWELNLGPGALAVVAGLVLLIGTRVPAVVGGWLAAIGGAWLVLGPMFASIWLGPAQTRVASSSIMSAVRPLGYHYGTGLVIALLGVWVAARRLLETRTAYTGRHYGPGLDLSNGVDTTPSTAPVEDREVVARREA